GPRQRQHQRLVDMALFGLGPRDDDLAPCAAMVRWKWQSQNGSSGSCAVDFVRCCICPSLERDLHCVTLNHHPRHRLTDQEPGILIPCTEYCCRLGGGWVQLVPNGVDDQRLNVVRGN